MTLHRHPSLTVSSAQDEVSSRFYLWSHRKEAVRLLDLIAIEQPERGRVLTAMFGTPVDYGYWGKNATRLRDMWKEVFSQLLDWEGEAQFGSRSYHARHEAITVFCKSHSSDAVISQMLADEASLVPVERIAPGRVAA